MNETFSAVFQPFVNMVDALMKGLNYLLGVKSLDLKEVIIEFKLLSESPIFTLSLYNIIFYILLFLMLFAFYKLLKFILSVPFRSIRKWVSRI